MKDNYFRDLIVLNKEKANILLTGVPYDKGCSCGKGAYYAPDKMRELSSYLPPLSMDGCDLTSIKIYDNGNINVNTLDDIYNFVLPIVEDNRFKLFIGGDHSITIPIQKRFIENCKKNNKKIGIIHIDAHPDICDFYNGSKTSHACTNARAIDNGIDPSDIVMIGIRGYEAQEVEYFNTHKELKVYQASYINEHGYKQMVDEIIDKFKNDYEIYLSYDIDANDPSFAPGTGTPEAFGLNSYQLMKIITTLIENLNINIMDIVEVAPTEDNNDITSWLALKTIYEIFKILTDKLKG